MDVTKIQKCVEDLMKELGLDLNDPNFSDTPKRIAKMYTQEIFKGLYTDLPSMAEFPNNGNGFLYTKVPFRSTCAHHFQPVKGVVHIFVDYRNAQGVLGLSKFNRVVDWCASRPTLQEDMTSHIMTTLKGIIKTEDICVIVQGEHSCVTDRGVCAAFSDTTTEVVGECSPDFYSKCMHYYRGVK